MTDHRVILEGIVGSTAYGLARAGSDEDRLGVFVAPTMDVAGLHWNPRRETHVSHDPDRQLHEVGKYLRLALKGNPTILELLWLDRYETCDAAGQVLLAVRRDVLSTQAVATAYLQYARAQATRLANRGDGTFSSDTRNRTTKHARHLLRLLVQGRELLLHGQLTVRVADPERYWAFDHMTPEQMLHVYESAAAATQAAAERSVLPDKPNLPAVQRTLEIIRRQDDLQRVTDYWPKETA